MHDALASPAFGQADLTNCEREMIHLAGSIQPHGLLLVLDEPALEIRKSSVNAPGLLETAPRSVIGLSLDALGGDIASCVRAQIEKGALATPQALRCRTRANAETREWEGMTHRGPGGELFLELERLDTDPDLATVDCEPDAMRGLLADAVERFGTATSIVALANGVVESLRAMTGYDRVMVYKFDPDGHGEIIAEARNPMLESLLGHRYPVSDIPQRARELYIRTRVRVLVDVAYEATPVEPHAQDLDMSLCYLRSMSPLHIHYLRNMGVTATLVISLVREGRLWGLIACHHYEPRRVRYICRAACELLAEVISTRITAIENYAHAQGVIQVRALEQRLVDATSADGDWKRALFRHPRSLLQPLDAGGAALFFEGEVLTAGEVPSSPQLRLLAEWIGTQLQDSLYSTASISRDNPALASLAPIASGVIAVKLSTSRPDYMMWFRPEQLSSVTWAGDPSKVIVDNDPLKLSPRRSFAAWVQMVRDTASPWSKSDLALARAICTTLIDIILQVQAVRLLIAQHQLSLVRVTVENSKEPVVISGGDGRILFANEMFERLRQASEPPPATLDDLPVAFTDPAQARAMLRALREQRLPWRGELSLRRSEGDAVPVGVRADIVPGAQGDLLGYIVILNDLSDAKRIEAARRQLENVLHRTSRGEILNEGGRAAQLPPDEVIGAILGNARIAALDIADESGNASLTTLIEDLESATRRATSIYAQIQSFGIRTR